MDRIPNANATSQTFHRIVSQSPRDRTTKADPHHLSDGGIVAFFVTDDVEDVELMLFQLKGSLRTMAGRLVIARHGWLLLSRSSLRSTRLGRSHPTNFSQWQGRYFWKNTQAICAAALPSSSNASMVAPIVAHSRERATPECLKISSRAFFC